MPRGKSGRPALPHLWLVTDPIRLADPLAAAQRLPRGAGVIYRAFGAADALETGKRLRRIADGRGLTLLVGADEALAMAIGADGLHLPERLASRLPLIRGRHPRWWITLAAHSSRAARHAKALHADAVIVSVVFPSRSPSAAAAMGAARLARLIRAGDLPVIALGGVTNETAPGLVRTGAYGLAAVEGLSA